MNRGVFNRELLSRIWLWLVVGVVAVVAYNSWALCCGRCTWNDLLHIPWWGGLLLVANLAAGSALVIISLCGRSASRPDSHCRGCSSPVGSGWTFCPLCGKRQGRSFLSRPGNASHH